MKLAIHSYVRVEGSTPFVPESHVIQSRVLSHETIATHDSASPSDLYDYVAFLRGTPELALLVNGKALLFS